MDNPLTQSPMRLRRRFGIRLREWRTTHGLTSAALANRLGCSSTYVLYWEGGSKPPPAAESAIGNRLYAIKGAPRPSAQELFLWALWGTSYSRAFLFLSKLLSGAYVGGASRPEPMEPVWQDIFTGITTLKQLAGRLNQGLAAGDMLDWLMAACSGFSFDFSRSAWDGGDFDMSDIEFRDDHDEESAFFDFTVQMDQLVSAGPSGGNGTYYEGRIIAHLRFPIPADSEISRLRGSSIVSVIPDTAWTAKLH